MHVGVPTCGEWLESDGLGGYAMGTTTGVRQRRYHGLLVAALTPPTKRFMLVADVEVWVKGPDGTTYLSSHRYLPDVVHPNGTERIASFSVDPWPRWTYRLADGTRLVHDLLVVRGSCLCVMSWRIVGAVKPLTLCVQPMLAYRSHHDLVRERPLNLHGDKLGNRVRFRPAPDMPALVALSNGNYEERPVWFHNFVYDEERARGFEGVEDLASPGIFCFDLIGREAALVFATEGNGIGGDDNAPGLVARVKLEEGKRRGSYPTPLHRAVDTYLVDRGEGLSVIAGYPWFTDWGRDTFIALRGLCLATGRYDEARRVLLAWARAIDGGMVPNRFPDENTAAEYNSVDASLWFIVAVGALLERVRLGPADRAELIAGIAAIIAAYQHGARHGIRVDDDGLLACGEPGMQLTWMDAKVGDWVVTPRSGKPVEVQALWVNALVIAARLWNRFEIPLAQARAAFDRRFWYEAGGYLYDVIDVDHVAGKTDSTFRANQLFAVGGLPVNVLAGPRARRVVDLALARLWTPVGPRSLAPGEPGYAPRYQGALRERDAAYHQGTVWPYLAGAFIEAWVRVHGDTPLTRRDARIRFLAPMLAALDPASSGHVAEIADAESPHNLRGCPFQAWSLGEALRLDLEVLAIPL